MSEKWKGKGRAYTARDGVVLGAGHENGGAADLRAKEAGEAGEDVRDESEHGCVSSRAIFVSSPYLGKIG